jgi:hypothetical protein
LYCLHLSFVVYPQFLGILRYLGGCMAGKPLQNMGYTSVRLEGKKKRPSESIILDEEDKSS